MRHDGAEVRKVLTTEPPWIPVAPMTTRRGLDDLEADMLAVLISETIAMVLLLDGMLSWQHEDEPVLLSYTHTLHDRARDVRTNCSVATCA